VVHLQVRINRAVGPMNVPFVPCIVFIEWALIWTAVWGVRGVGSSSGMGYGWALNRGFKTSIRFKRGLNLRRKPSPPSPPPDCRSMGAVAKLTRGEALIFGRVEGSGRAARGWAAGWGTLTGRVRSGEIIEKRECAQEEKLKSKRGSWVWVGESAVVLLLLSDGWGDGWVCGGYVGVLKMMRE